MTTFAYQVAPRPMTLRSFAVAELMTPRPLAFEMQMPVSKAAALLNFNQLDAAPVVDDRHRLVGVVTAASCAAWEDFSRRSAPHGFGAEGLDLTPVWEIASTVFEKVRDDASTHEVIDLLAERRARRIYVVNDREELVGVVSMADLIRHLAERDADALVTNTGAAC
jgi:CBS-domain-containing membrane protein